MNVSAMKAIAAPPWCAPPSSACATLSPPVTSIVFNPSYGFEVRLNPCCLCIPLLESAPSEVGRCRCSTGSWRISANSTILPGLQPALAGSAAEPSGPACQEAWATGGTGRQRDHDHPGVGSQLAFQQLQGVLRGCRSHPAALGLSQSPLLCALHRLDPACVGAFDGVSAHPDGTQDGPLLYRQHAPAGVSPASHPPP